MMTIFYPIFIITISIISYLHIVSFIFDSFIISIKIINTTIIIIIIIINICDSDNNNYLIYFQ